MKSWMASDPRAFTNCLAWDRMLLEMSECRERKKKKKKKPYCCNAWTDSPRTNDSIKKAYRRKALELHPDRNYGNVETATKLFTEVRSAYEVLCDPQERAWYDSHHDALSRSAGGTSPSNASNNQMTTSDDILGLFSKFTAGMEFSDSRTGFYGGLREVFARLALEEKTVCQREGSVFTEYPTFGMSYDDFESVVAPFYVKWSSFSTKKSFAWRDAYRYSEAPDRRTRRFMEKENKHLREAGIREFNDMVRSLVAFARKRDPRYKKNVQSEAERQEALRRSAAAQGAKTRAMNQSKLREYVAPNWMKEVHPEYDEQNSSESELECFDCVVCRKSFRSQNQLEAHERSKKHAKAVKHLRREMRTEDKRINLQADKEKDRTEEVLSETEAGQEADNAKTTSDPASSDEAGTADCI